MKYSLFIIDIFVTILNAKLHYNIFERRVGHLTVIIFNVKFKIFSIYLRTCQQM